MVEIDSIDKQSAVGTEYITSLQDSGTFLVVLLPIFSSYGTSAILKLTAMVRRQTEDKETEGQKTRFEQTAAVVEAVQEGNQTMPSGVTLYTVKDGKIDEGRFIRMDKK